MHLAVNIFNYINLVACGEFLIHFNMSSLLSRDKLIAEHDVVKLEKRSQSSKN